MSPQLHNLPDELLVDVFGWLPKSDLKSARLTCARFGRIGAQWLFQRVYFAPRQSAIETFINISSNPVFARNVKELIYDGRLFLQELTKYESYKAAFDDCESNQLTEIEQEAARWKLAKFGWRQTGYEDYHESLAETLVGYTHLFNQQQQIIDDKRDYEALCAGLQTLPNITTVFVVDDFLRCGGWTPLETDDHTWYYRQSQREIAVPVPPSSWAPDLFRQELFDKEEVGKWDVRSIQNLIRAVSQHGHRVSGLNISAKLSSAPVSIFPADQHIWAHGCRMAQRLELLKVQAHHSGGYSDVERRAPENRLGLFMAKAKNLRYLAISGDIEPEVFIHDFWPHLETLILETQMVSADDLKAIIRTHKGTLREIRFRNLIICGKEGWADVAKETGKYLRLRHVGVYGVGDEVTGERTGSYYLSTKDQLALARSFMQSTPQTTLLNEQHWDVVSDITMVACPEENTPCNVRTQCPVPQSAPSLDSSIP